MNWQYLDSDRELYECELESFVPPRIFDAHAHLYENRNFNAGPPPLLAQGPASVGWDVYRHYIAQILPRRRVSGLFFSFPSPSLDFAASNDFLIRQVRRDPSSRGLMLVSPDMDPEFIREEVRREGFVGLKCYHFYSAEHPSYIATIPSYLPEQQVQIAHEEGLVIMLHIVRLRGLDDPSNKEVIRRYAECYPNARFILAHAARGFNPHHTVLGIGALQGLRNVWCDTSAVNECGAFEVIAHTLGVDRLLYGSDFPVTHFRGRCVAIGDSFLWVSSENTDFHPVHGDVHPTLVGIESLRALKLACMNLRLRDSEVESVFYGNSAELLSLQG